MKNSLKITAQGEREIRMTRMFDAPREMVFDAWTKPELLKRWLGARAGWEMAIAEIDLKVGGRYRWVWRHKDRGEMGMGGVYREIARPSLLVFTERFDDPWYPGEGLNTLELTEERGKTTMITTTLYESREARDGVMQGPAGSGVAESYDKLEEMLTSM